MYFRTLLFVLFTAVFISHGLHAQSCLPNGITFTTQGEIDNFSINYPGCTVVEGDVTIELGSGISNVDGLSGLTTIGGDLKIFSTVFLANLDGLSNLTSIGGNLNISYNHSLLYLDGLSNVTSIGGGLSINNSPALMNVDGLSGLISIGGGLGIDNNKFLSNLDGLSNLTSVSNNVVIFNNIALTDCCGIQDLLASSGVGGSIYIHDNPSECSNLNEILAADCAIGTLSQKVNTSSLLLSPNPAGDILQISLEDAPAGQQAHLLIVNPLGQTVLDRPHFRLGEAISIRHLPKGFFTVRIETESNIFVNRLVKN